MTKPDPEVPERPARRRFTAEDKLRILHETDSAPAGTISAILRREGMNTHGAYGRSPPAA